MVHFNSLCPNIFQRKGRRRKQNNNKKEEEKKEIHITEGQNVPQEAEYQFFGTMLTFICQWFCLYAREICQFLSVNCIEQYLKPNLRGLTTKTDKACNCKI